MKRRDFLRYSSIAGGASLLNLDHFPYHLFAAPKKKHAQDVVTLGKTGIRLSRLAQGTGTIGGNKHSHQTNLGIEGLADLFRAGVDNGLNFWDLADSYGSHPHAKEALKTVRREKVVIMTKTSANTEEQMRADLDRFRQEIGTDYIDIVLLHCMLKDDWPERKAGAMAVLSEVKAKGLIRTHGTSCHTLGSLKTAANSDWVEVDLARLNPIGSHMDADPQTVIGVLKEMKAKGKGIIGMKILGEGDLRHKVDEALQFALAQDVLDCFTIGAENRGEMEELLSKIPAASVRA
ncbi:MAG TPA: aldo/keto reductase [Acidobacteriota bacterium]|jgi:aryl-alcohol dehydrogenase-like predicted oxidoreductase